MENTLPKTSSLTCSIKRRPRSPTCRTNDQNVAVHPTDAYLSLKEKRNPESVLPSGIAHDLIDQCLVLSVSSQRLVYVQFRPVPQASEPARSSSDRRSIHCFAATGTPIRWPSGPTSPVSNRKIPLLIHAESSVCEHLLNDIQLLLVVHNVCFYNKANLINFACFIDLNELRRLDSKI